MPRPGYYSWRHPDGYSIAIGFVSEAAAIAEATAANLHILERRPTVVDRLTGATRTVEDLLGKMPVAEKVNTAKSNRSLDKRIRAALGKRPVGTLAVVDFSELIEGVIAEGKARLAQALRSRCVAMCKRGMGLGWMESNPAEVTTEPTVKVKRGRLTLELFQAIYAKAPEVNEWLQRAMMLALVSGQDRSTVAAMKREHVVDKRLITWRTKTRESNQPLAIPLALRLDVVGVSLSDLVAEKSGVISPYLLHHVSPWGNAPPGSAVHVNAISKAFTAARKLAGVPDKGAPTFHEIRSLAKRLYEQQGNVDTKALLGHATERAADIYADPRGIEPIEVRVG
jgi:integrase